METTSETRRGLILVIASPSGAGKSTLSQTLLRQESGTLRLSVSVTTRPKRASEVHGVHYEFLTIREFERLRDQGDLLEWAEVHGNFYGTPRAPVQEALAQGRDILFDIDVQGTLQVYDSMRPDVASVFILPPSIEELERRLHRRAEDDEATIRRRLRGAKAEIACWDKFDYVLVNDDLDRAFNELQAILRAERLRRVRAPHLNAFVAGLDRDLDAMIAKS